MFRRRGRWLMIRYRYSEWDGTQEIPPLDADDVLENLTDDLMNFGDLQHALRNLLQRGMKNPMGQRMQGLRDLLQQLRQQRRQTLDQYNLSSVFEDLQKKLNEIVQRERDTIQRRLDDALKSGADGAPQDNAGGSDTDAAGDQIDAGESGEGEQGQGEGGDQGDFGPGEQGQRGGQQGQRSSSGARGQVQRGQSGQRSQSGQAGEPGQSGQGAEGGEQSQESEFARMLRNIAGRKQEFLDQLPTDLGGAVKELQNYEFMDPEAQAQFQELMESLKKAMMETFFKDIYQQIQNMTPEDLARLKHMVRDLNRMLQEKMAGGQPDFDQFMQQYGDLFGNNPPESLDDLIRQMQQQMAMMQNLLD